MNNFTKREWDIIKHRLDVPDAIMDALTDVDSPEFSHEAIDSAIQSLDFNGQNISVFNDVELAVIRECCEGSTYFADMDDAVAMGEINRGDRLASHKAAAQLERRLNLTIPRD